LVEDVTEIGLVVQRYGRRAGFAVEQCTSAEAAWEFLQRSRPDLVLLDVHLPGASGLELCRRLRGTPGLADLPIALFSQADRPEDEQAGREAGANDVLSKELLGQPEVWSSRLRQILRAAPR
jgi:DNA-binding response OmpR family regulator